MPIYEYRCERGHDFEEFQRMADDPLTTCTICGAPAQRVFSPIAVHFKGSGFYTTDYGKKKVPASGNSDSKDDSSSSSKDSKDSKKDSKKESRSSDSSSKSSTSSSD
jgi:putative FmdB family regulatory protein